MRLSIELRAQAETDKMDEFNKIMKEPKNKIKIEELRDRVEAYAQKFYMPGYDY